MYQWGKLQPDMIEMFIESVAPSVNLNLDNEVMEQIVDDIDQELQCNSLFDIDSHKSSPFAKNSSPARFLLVRKTSDIKRMDIDQDKSHHVKLLNDELETLKMTLNERNRVIDSQHMEMESMRKKMKEKDVLFDEQLNELEAVWKELLDKKKTIEKHESKIQVLEETIRKYIVGQVNHQLQKKKDMLEKKKRQMQGIEDSDEEDSGAFSGTITRLKSLVAKIDSAAREGSYTVRFLKDTVKRTVEAFLWSVRKFSNKVSDEDAVASLLEVAEDLEDVTNVYLNSISSLYKSPKDEALSVETSKALEQMNESINSLSNTIEEAQQFVVVPTTEQNISRINSTSELKESSKVDSSQKIPEVSDGSQDELRKKIESLSNENATLNAQIQEIRNTMKEKEQLYSRTETQNGMYTEQIKTLQLQLSNILRKEKKEHLGVKLKNSNQEFLNESQKKVDEIVNQNLKLTQTLKQKQKVLDKLQSQKLEMKVKIEKLKEGLERQRDINNELQSKLQQLNSFRQTHYREMMKQQLLTNHPESPLSVQLTPRAHALLVQTKYDKDLKVSSPGSPKDETPKQLLSSSHGIVRRAKSMMLLNPTSSPAVIGTQSKFFSPDSSSYVQRFPQKIASPSHYTSMLLQPIDEPDPITSSSDSTTTSTSSSSSSTSSKILNVHITTTNKSSS
eukprot:TRINITY_DN1877_c0_g2_i2.p1 TRINITY_DN1877_c0_g2~~TRINITY_DN1877_c0_g2_i2.p1  ORF type:complete len:675 (-),score=219.95 TRINITY_DN1877_c0_g2_i2:62-2086(-)